MSAATLSVASIIIVGVGGRGCAALHQLKQQAVPDNVTTIAISTDQRALNSTFCDSSILLGEALAARRSTGGKAELAAAAVQQSAPLLRQTLSNAGVIIMLTGLGGGNGSGAATELARLVAELNIPLLVFATLPFGFEGKRCMTLAQQSLQTLQQQGAAVVVLPNDQLQHALGPGTRLETALDAGNQFLLAILRQIAAMLSDNGLINMDFNDFVSIVSQPGLALAGTAETQQGETLPDLLQQLLQNPLLQQSELSHAKAALLHIAAGEHFTLQQFEAIGQQLAHTLPNATLLLQGLTLHAKYKDKLTLLLLASGISADCATQPLCV